MIDVGREKHGIARLDRMAAVVEHDLARPGDDIIHLLDILVLVIV
jgi:hypothetical protein